MVKFDIAKMREYAASILADGFPEGGAINLCLDEIDEIAKECDARGREIDRLRNAMVSALEGVQDAIR